MSAEPHALDISLGSRADLEWAQQTVVQHHYLQQRVHYQARPWVYVIRYGEQRLGLVMVALPHATVNGNWWGGAGRPTQWQVVDLCRIWLDGRLQRGGAWCRAGIVPGFVDRKGQWQPSTATWAIQAVLARIQRDWVSLNPLVYPDQPYHVRLVVSYHNPLFHAGTIYRHSHAIPMYTDKRGNPAPSPSSGKFGWCWRLPEPAWTWEDIEIIRPRTMRLF